MKRIWTNFLTTWRRQTSMQIATLSVLVGTFTVILAFLLIHQNLQTLLTRWGREVKMSVYLKDEATHDEVSKIRKVLNESDFSHQTEYLSKDEAARRFREKLGQISPGIFTDPEFENPLPASFEIVLKSGISDAGDYQQLVSFAKSLAGMDGVEEVSYGQGWIENYATVLKVFSWLSGILLFILLSGGLFIIGNSIRNSVSQRQDEIAIYELFGATRWMIQTPYIMEGAIMGASASVLATALVYILYRWQVGYLTEHLQFWGFTSALEFLSVARISLLVFGATLLGALGAYLCVRQYNTGWSAAEAEASWSR